MFECVWAPIWYAIVVATSAVVLVLAGCSGPLVERTVAGTPVPESSTSSGDEAQAGAKVPVAVGQEARAAAFGVMRLVDPCALHAPKEAARVSGVDRGRDHAGAHVERVQAGVDQSGWRSATVDA
ncbi:hypothetical protein GCM10023148_08780 [Actinokineospora soli]